MTASFIRGFRRALPVSFAPALLILIAGPARAEGDNRLMEEIVVTAQKKEQNIQEVPISITAITSRDIERDRMETPLDVAYKTPGVVGAVQAGVPSFTIRGIGTNDFGSAADPAVGIYLDGVYASRTVASLIGLYDVERIEVIKGPQGTLFGRSAAAGAISIISKKPDEARSASLEAEYGDLNNLRVLGRFNVPLGDNVFFRFSALSHQRDGYVKNVLNGNDLDNIDDKGARAALRFLPSDNIDVTLSADYLKADNNGVGLKSATIPFPGDSGSPFGNVAHDLLKPVSDLENKGASAHVVANLGTGTTLTSITAYRGYDFTILEDDDGSLVELLNTGTLPEKSDTYSQEFRLNSVIGDKISWFLGASYYHEKISTEGVAQSNLDVLFGPGSGGSFEERSHSKGDFDSYSIYTDMTFSLTPKLDLIAGLRWARDEKKFRLYVPPNPAIGVNLLFGGVDPEARLNKSWTSVQPRVVLQYYPAEGVMTYVSAARGYKPGGFGSFELQPPFDPEFVWSYEAGVKSTLAGGKLRLNSAVFYYDYTDLQVTTQVGLALQTTNASEATGKGFEVEATWLPVPNLELTAAVNWLDATYDRFLQGELDPLTFLPVTFDRSGNRLSRAPRLQYNLGIQRTQPFGFGNVVASADYVYQSKLYFHPANDSFRSQDGYGLLSARFAIEPDDARWTLSLFGENLLDEEYLLDAGGLAEPLGSPVTLAGAPRTYGIKLTLSM